MTDLDTADLRTLMDRALTDIDVPTTRLHDESVRRGRSARRRRRVGAAIGGVFAAAAVTALALPGLSGSTPTEGTVAHESVGSHRTTQPSDPTPAGWWDMPGAQMRNRLAGLLPDGLAITDANLGDEDLAPGDKPHGGWLQVDVATAGGRPAGGLNVVLYSPQPEDGSSFVRSLTTCPGNLLAPDSCTELRDDAGDVRGRLSSSTSGGVVVLEAVRLTPEGALVYAAASNSSDDKWGLGSSTDGDAAPVTLAQLRRIATDPVWADGTSRR